MENAGTLVGQRSLQWDLSMVEPGLLLRVGPTADTNSVLEFVMDPNHDRGDRFHVEDPSTGTNFQFRIIKESNRGICSHIYCTSRKIEISREKIMPFRVINFFVFLSFIYLSSKKQNNHLHMFRRYV